MTTRLDRTTTPSSPPMQLPRLSAHRFVARPRIVRKSRSSSATAAAAAVVVNPIIAYPRYEKCTMIMLFVIAWGWILGTVYMLARFNLLPPFNTRSTHPPVSPETVAGIKGEPQKSPPSDGGGDVPISPFSTKSDLETHLEPFSSPLVVFTCHRPQYLRKTLEDIYQYRDKTCRMGCPLIVSQDGRDDEGIVQVVDEYTRKFSAVGIPLIHLVHQNESQQHLRKVSAYELLAVHYGWALGKIFGDELEFQSPAEGLQRTLKANRVIILEEDIHIAVDFFNYFAAMAPILDHDPRLLAVSAFNDNGLSGRVSDPKRVLRSDFFPGLGWMMTRKLWKDELAAKWPKGYWDDWLREPAQRRGRHILRPEVSRTFHFGTKGGASKNQFGETLSHIKLNEDSRNWSQHDIASSIPTDRFDRDYWPLLHAARRVDSVTEAQEHIQNGNVRMEYRDLAEFADLAGQFDLMPDEKAGIPRTSYNGVVETRLDGKHFLFLTPPMEELQQSFLSAI